MQCTLKKALALLGLCALMPLSAAQAQDYRLPPPPAEKGIELTDFLRVKPYARFAAFYTSNFFQEQNRRKEGDTTFALTVGSDVLVGDIESNFFEAGYAFTQNLYLKHPEQNTPEHLVRYNTKLQLHDTLTFTSSGSGAWRATNTDPQFAGRVRNFTGFSEAALEFRPIDTFGLRADGDVAYLENFPREFEPANNLSSRAGLFVIISPNLPWGLELEAGGNYRQIHYVDKNATNPDLEFVSAQLGVRATNKVMELKARAGYEVGWVKKRNSFSRQSEVDDGLFASGAMTLFPNQTTTFTLFGLHQISFSASGAFQRLSAIGAVLRQEIPVVEGLYAFVGADWNHQDVQHGLTTRTQSYRAGAGWSPIEYLELGVQTSYIRSSSRGGGFETFEVGGQITLSI